MRTRTPSRAGTPSGQRGSSLIMVLVFLLIMLLGALSMARMAGENVLMAGNIAFRDAAYQASEIGVNRALDRVLALPGEENSQAGWYFANSQPAGANGLPAIDWNSAPQEMVGPYQVRYVVERMCQGNGPVTDHPRFCLVQSLPQIGSAKAGAQALKNPSARQFRITVNTAGPRNTTVFTQTTMVR